MQKNAECSELREETKERPQHQARYAVSIEYKMVRADIHRRPTSWNVRLCAVDDSPLCLRLVPLFFMVYPFISFTSLSSRPIPTLKKDRDREANKQLLAQSLHKFYCLQLQSCEDLQEIKY